MFNIGVLTKTEDWKTVTWNASK